MVSYNWRGSAGGQWGNQNNWFPAFVPGASDDAVFNSTVATEDAVSLGGATYSIAALTINAQGGGGFSFQDGTLDFSSGQIIASTAASTPDFGGSGLPIIISVTEELQLGAQYSTSTLGFGSNATITGAGYLQISGSGTTNLDNTDTYAGGTQIIGGTLALGTTSSLSTGTVSFVYNSAGGSFPTLQSVSGALSNAIQIDAGTGATIGAENGDILSLTGAFADNGGAGTTLHFGSASDTGVLIFNPGSDAGVAAGGALAIDGGSLLIRDSAAAQVVGAVQGGVAVGTGSTAALLDIDGNSTTLNNLSGNSSGVIINNGTTAATLTVDNIVNTTYSGKIEDGTGALALVVAGSLELFGNNTFSGGVTIDANADLLLGNVNAAGDTTITFAGVGTLYLASGATPTSSEMTIIGFTANDGILLEGFGAGVTESLANTILTISYGATTDLFNIPVPRGHFTPAEFSVVQLTPFSRAAVTISTLPAVRRAPSPCPARAITGTR